MLKTGELVSTQESHLQLCSTIAINCHVLIDFSAVRREHPYNISDQLQMAHSLYFYLFYDRSVFKETLPKLCFSNRSYINNNLKSKTNQQCLKCLFDLKYDS